jgi:hypothetical protein
MRKSPESGEHCVCTGSLLIGFWFVMQLFSAGEVTQSVQKGGVAYLRTSAGL